LSLPGFCQEDDDKLLEELEIQKRKQAQPAIQIDQTQEDITNAVLSFPEELKKLGHKAIDSAALQDKRVLKLMQKLLRNNPLQTASREEVRSLVLDKVQGRPLERFLSQNPKILDTVVDLLRDKEAMPALVGILIKQDKLKLYFIFWVGLFISYWIIRKYVFNKDWSRRKSFSMRLLLSLLFTATTLTVFFQMFHPELMPTVRIIADRF
jgi:hypothetical protein